MEGIETSLHGSGQLDYEISQTDPPASSNQITGSSASSNQITGSVPLPPVVTVATNSLQRDATSCDDMSSAEGVVKGLTDDGGVSEAECVVKGLTDDGGVSEAEGVVKGLTDDGGVSEAEGVVKGLTDDGGVSEAEGVVKGLSEGCGEAEGVVKELTEGGRETEGVGVKGLSEVDELKNDMTSVWGMSRSVKYDSENQTESPPPSITPHVTTVTPSHQHQSPTVSHSRDSMEWESKSPVSSHHHSSHAPPSQGAPINNGDTTAHQHHTITTHTLTSSQPHPSDTSPLQTKSSVAMETETKQIDQSSSRTTVAMTTDEPSFPWFSLTPRTPCETKPVVAVATAGISEGGGYQVIGPGGQSVLTPQQQLLPSSGVMQYYITSSGALAAPTQQVQMGYALVGNTLVPQQFLAAPQQQFIISQGGIQYVVGGTGGLVGLGGLGGVAVVPSGGGLGGQQGLVQTIGGGGGVIGEGVVQAIAEGRAVVVGDGTTATVAPGNSGGVKTVAIDNSRSGAVVHVTDDKQSTNQTTEPPQSVVKREDTQVSMETTTSGVEGTQRERKSATPHTTAGTVTGTVLHRA